MSPVAQQGFIPSEVTVKMSASENIKISNPTCTLADTEYNLVLTDNLKQLIIKCRGAAALKIAFTENQSGTAFISIPKGCVFTLSDLNLIGKTLYFQASLAATQLEIAEFY